MAQDLTLESFRPHVGTPFHIQDGAEDLTHIELVEVKSLGPENEKLDPQVRSDPFRLTFRLRSKSKYYEQQIFTLKHDALGELDIFLVPVGPDAEGILYDAVFN